MENGGVRALHYFVTNCGVRRYTICILAAGELPKSEQVELIEYFDEIKLPYCLADGYLYIVGEVGRDTVFERLEHFYDGRAEVFPF